MSFNRLNRTNSLKKIGQSYTGLKPTITSATGGSVSTPGNGFTVHTYNGSDTFTITGLSGNITNVDYTSTYRKVGGTFAAPGSALQYVLVGGGGAGGGNAGAGGGAGGFRTNQPGHPRAGSDTTSPLSMGVDYTIQVGAGGPQDAANGQPSGILQPSNPNFTSLQTTGGGGGCNSSDPARPGGSGGGAAGPGNTGGGGNAGGYNPSEGQNGGVSNSGCCQNRSGGGGGGAGGAGNNTSSNSSGAPGGSGISITFDGTPRTFCGGGGGSSHYGGGQPSGGPGGGGNGGYGLWLTGNENNGSNATAGGVNTGGGGGAGPGGGGIGKSGGSGKIMLRY